MALIYVSPEQTDTMYCFISPVACQCYY
uniref:Uncharacterized protein n=1 Tax=Arundo donax TaxID=35708 RepID=A0A0A9GLT2_ARUDO